MSKYSLRTKTPVASRGCSRVVTVKHKDDGTIKRFKVRLLVKECIQKAGIDYTKTFSSIIKLTIVRTLLGIAVKKEWSIFQLDVNNGFLHDELREEVYIKVPPGLVVHKP